MNPDEPDAPRVRTCIVCSKPLVEGGEFCPSCGARNPTPVMTTVIDAYVQNRVDQEISDRLKDQTGVVRELGDKAEEVVLKRFKTYMTLFGALVAVLAFVGIKSVRDLLEPVAQRVETLKPKIDETAAKVDDALAAAQSAQKHVSEATAEITHRLDSLSTTATDAQNRLETMTKSMETRVNQVSKEVDNFSIQQAYPTLGQQKYVTFLNRPWKGNAGKGPHDKWVNVTVALDAVSNFSEDQLTALVNELKAGGYTPFVGMFGVGGPYSTSFEHLDGGGVTEVVYFRAADKPMASELKDMVARNSFHSGLRASDRPQDSRHA